MNSVNAYDCIKVMAYGIHQAGNMTHNYTAFKNTGYFGFTNAPISLTDNGDPELPYYLFQIDRNYNWKVYAITDLRLSTIKYLNQSSPFKFDESM
ncbi:UNVERIFIED_CONTAM: hypothetical protein HDU68_007382 [Siphonaria sp. JEL0065]|nr:hypothetical protein HDU68_007382 [Siphonaria sp. JEL0065]